MKTDTIIYIFTVEADLDMEIISTKYESVKYKIELTEAEWMDANETGDFDEILAKKVREKYMKDGVNRHDLYDSVSVFIDTYEEDERVVISPMKVMELEGEKTLWQSSIAE